MAVPRAGKALSHCHCVFFCFLITPVKTALLLVIIWVTQQSDTIKQWKRKMTFKYQCLEEGVQIDVRRQEAGRCVVCSRRVKGSARCPRISGSLQVLPLRIRISVHTFIALLHNTRVALSPPLFLFVHQLTDSRKWTSACIREFWGPRRSCFYNCVKLTICRLSDCVLNPHILGFQSS